MSRTLHDDRVFGPLVLGQCASRRLWSPSGVAMETAATAMVVVMLKMCNVPSSRMLLDYNSHCLFQHLDQFFPVVCCSLCSVNQVPHYQLHYSRRWSTVFSLYILSSALPRAVYTISPFQIPLHPLPLHANNFSRVTTTYIPLQRAFQSITSYTLALIQHFISSPCIPNP